MPKKMITTEQKVEKYLKRKRIALYIKILAGIIGIALLIPAVYYGYYYVVFTVMPQNDYDPDKNVGSGYSRPLHLISANDTKNHYVLAYYYNDQWSVVDDSQKIIENRDNFTIYKDDDEWHEGTHLQLLIFKNSFLMMDLPLAESTLIDSRCFKDCMKKMTMEEFLDYCKEKGLQTDYIH